MRITSRGQVTIPAAIRSRFGFLPETLVEFRVEGRAVRLVKAEPRKGRDRGGDVISRLSGSASVKMSTDEIMALTRRR
jgi:AbrB family looped-hinge helix DNA binding protein